MELNGHTIRPGRKLLIESPIPSQTEIREMMASRYGRRNALTLSLVQTCAEVAEGIILDLVLSSSLPKRPLRITLTRHQSSRGNSDRKLRMTGYNCPRCHYTHIRKDDKYCGGCGNPIEFNL